MRLEGSLAESDKNRSRSAPRSGAAVSICERGAIVFWEIASAPKLNHSSKSKLFAEPSCSLAASESLAGRVAIKGSDFNSDVTDVLVTRSLGAVIPYGSEFGSQLLRAAITNRRLAATKPLAAPQIKPVHDLRRGVSTISCPFPSSGAEVASAAARPACQPA